MAKKYLEQQTAVDYPYLKPDNLDQLASELAAMVLHLIKLPDDQLLTYIQLTCRPKSNNPDEETSVQARTLETIPGVGIVTKAPSLQFHVLSMTAKDMISEPLSMIKDLHQEFFYHMLVAAWYHETCLGAKMLSDKLKTVFAASRARSEALHEAAHKMLSLLPLTEIDHDQRHILTSSGVPLVAAITEWQTRQNSSTLKEILHAVVHQSELPTALWIYYLSGQVKNSWKMLYDTWQEVLSEPILPTSEVKQTLHIASYGLEKVVQTILHDPSGGTETYYDLAFYFQSTAQQYCNARQVAGYANWILATILCVEEVMTDLAGKDWLSLDAKQLHAHLETKKVTSVIITERSAIKLRSIFGLKSVFSGG